jgi:hypothetical protein
MAFAVSFTIDDVHGRITRNEKADAKPQTLTIGSGLHLLHGGTLARRQPARKSRKGKRAAWQGRIYLTGWWILWWMLAAISVAAGCGAPYPVPPLLPRRRGHRPR